MPGLRGAVTAWLVVYRIDDGPTVVVPFEEEADARALYDELRVGWSEVWLCQVVAGPVA